MDMGPYDMLRSVLGNERSDDEIEIALEANGYDLTAALLALMGGQNGQAPVATTPMGSESVQVLLVYWALC